MEERQLRILLIEDLPVYVLFLRQVLKENQMESEIARSLAEGLRLAESKTFDAVLLDLGLPDSHGLHTFLEFQSAQPSLPVIILSGLDDENLAAKAVQLGAQDYLTKGSYLTQGGAGSKLLVRSVQYAVERQRIQSALLHERSLLEMRVNERTTEIREANQRLHTLAARLVSAQEDERRRVAVELHDEAGQALTALGLNLSLMRSEITEDNAKLDNQLSEAIELTKVTLERLRILAHDLRPPFLNKVGLDQILRDYCHRVGSHSQIKVEYRSTGLDALPEPVQINLYRVVQEAFTNIVKHARATQVWVQLENDAEGVLLSIRDNGVGFSLMPGSENHPMEGIGLIGMQERVEALGGTFEIHSQPGEGVAIRVYISSQEEA